MSSHHHKWFSLPFGLHILTVQYYIFHRLPVSLLANTQWMVNPPFQVSPSAPRRPQLVYCRLPHLLTTSITSHLYYVHYCLFREWGSKNQLGTRIHHPKQSGQTAQSGHWTAYSKDLEKKSDFYFPFSWLHKGTKVPFSPVTSGITYWGQWLVFCLTGTISYLYVKTHFLKATDKERALQRYERRTEMRLKCKHRILWRWK